MKTLLKRERLFQEVAEGVHFSLPKRSKPKTLLVYQKISQTRGICRGFLTNDEVPGKNLMEFIGQVVEVKPNEQVLL